MQTATPELTQKASRSIRENASSPPLGSAQSFVRRHIGPNEKEVAEMLAIVGFHDLDALIDATIPANIRLARPLDLPGGKSEHQALAELRAIAGKNKVFRSLIGAGYSDCITPPVIQRNILENPGWYTAYTPYQAEVAQGRLEALLNFQTMIIDLTGLDISNASLLDEATAAAEAMAMCFGLRPVGKMGGATSFFVSESCHPQTVDVVRTRAEPLGIKVIVGDHRTFAFDEPVFGVLLQYPATDGTVFDYAEFIKKAHAANALAVVAADILGLTLLRPPGEFGADIAVGSTQRFGVPLGFGGPHAAYLATRDAYKRLMPGRLVGVSHDAQGRPAYRLALQTREQHIRRDKATSNICTAQVLLAVIASMYAVYHGPEGLRRIAQRIHVLALLLAEGLAQLGCRISHEPMFDTVRVELDESEASAVMERARDRHINLRRLNATTICVALDETTDSLEELFEIFAKDRALDWDHAGLADEILAALSSDENQETASAFAEPHARTSRFLTHPVFNTHHTETEMLRYLRRLEARDLSLTTSMIPLGSCTMKLNATAEMFPISWPEFAKLHPFAPVGQTAGYREMFEQLEKWLAEITGFAAVSLQPNAGSQGEYAGLLAIRAFHAARGQGHRNVCLIPQSAHGTNPASSVMAGFKVVPVHCLKHGDIDMADLRKKAEAHRHDLAALMVTYPSTHGVFESGIRDVCDLIHEFGGQVYMDGANMNAQVGLCRPGDFGADVCHLNLHKTFCIPHGGGGPGVGPIGVAAHLAEFLPRTYVVDPVSGTVVFGEGEQGRRPPVGSGDPGQRQGNGAVGNVSAAPFGSASILTISWMYIAMMGGTGLTEASKIAILNANYIAKRLGQDFPILFQGNHGLVAHECILDLRQWKPAGIEVEDVAKRLMDYGFHAPTVSWPVPGTMMVEPTESESKDELDRFCEAMILIHREIEEVVAGKVDRENNVLTNAPHTAADVTADTWNRPYGREQAAWPAPWTREHKFWPAIGRIDNVYGDRNLICSCAGMEDFAE